MPISMNCPHCDEPYNLADRQLGKKVRCKTCEHVFTVEEPNGKGGGSKGGSIRGGGPGAGPGPRLSAAAKPRRSRDDDEDDFDDRDEDRPRRRERQGASTGKWVLLAVLVLLGLGGVGVGVWLIVREDESSDTKTAESSSDSSKPQGAAQQNPFGGQKPNPLGGGRRPVGGEQPSPRIKQKSVKDLPTEELLALLTGENLDGVHRRKEAMAELARRKEVKAAPAIAARLPNFFDRQEAVSALRTLGPVAAQAVLPYMHHKDGGVAEAARGLLDDYGTKLELQLEQTAKDFDSSEDGRRRQALDWLANRPPPAMRPPQADDLARGLERLLGDRGQSEKAMRALLVWGSAKNVPAIAKLVGAARIPGGLEKQGMDFLAKYPDPAGAAALARQLGNFFAVNEVEKALRDMGKVAEKEVVQFLHDPEDRKRDSARRLLKGYKTEMNVLLAQTVEDLRSGDGKRRYNAAGWLAVTPRVGDSPHLGALAKGLDAALVTRGPFDKMETFQQAIVAWASKDSVPLLVRLLADDVQAHLEAQPGARPRIRTGAKIFPFAPQAMTTLADLKDPRGVPILLEELFWRTADAESALRAMGPIAEKGVQRLLSHPRPDARLAACALLKDIGTKDSIVPLTKRSKIERVGAVKTALKEALEAVNERAGVKPPDTKKPDK